MTQRRRSAATSSPPSRSAASLGALARCGVSVAVAARRPRRPGRGPRSRSTCWAASLLGVRARLGRRPARPMARHPPAAGPARAAAPRQRRARRLHHVLDVLGRDGRARRRRARRRRGAAYAVSSSVRSACCSSLRRPPHRRRRVRRRARRPASGRGPVTPDCALARRPRRGAWAPRCASLSSDACSAPRGRGARWLVNVVGSAVLGVLVALRGASGPAPRRRSWRSSAPGFCGVAHDVRRASPPRCSTSPRRRGARARGPRLVARAAATPRVSVARLRGGGGGRRTSRPGAEPGPVSARRPLPCRRAQTRQGPRDHRHRPARPRRRGDDVRRPGPCGGRSRRCRARSPSPGSRHRSTCCATSAGSRTCTPTPPTTCSSPQGYVHAQDRFWEMDFRRHITAGRLSEMFGKSQVETDTFLRISGWRRVAEQELPLLSAETRRNLDAYARGVNAYLADHSGATASFEYAVLGLQNPVVHDRAVDAGRLDRLAQGDGLGPARQHAGGDPALDHQRDRSARRAPRSSSRRTPTCGTARSSRRAPSSTAPGTRTATRVAVGQAAASASPPSRARRSPALGAAGTALAVARRACSARTARASARTRGWSAATRPTRASRCSPTTRTSHR